MLHAIALPSESGAMLLVAIKRRDASAPADLTANEVESVFECVAKTLDLLRTQAHSSKANETILFRQTPPTNRPLKPE
jgi:hypothetical protein